MQYQGRFLVDVWRDNIVITLGPFRINESEPTEARTDKGSPFILLLSAPDGALLSKSFWELLVCE
jgi:hypothetical protein